MSMNNACNVTFGESYSYRTAKRKPEEFYAMNMDSKLNVLFDMLNVNNKTLVENQKTITQNQKVMQDANYAAFKSFYINNPKGFDCVKVDSAFNNKIDLVI